MSSVWKLTAVHFIRLIRTECFAITPLIAMNADMSSTWIKTREILRCTRYWNWMQNNHKITNTVIIHEKGQECLSIPLCHYLKTDQMCVSEIRYRENCTDRVDLQLTIWIALKRFAMCLKKLTLWLPKLMQVSLLIYLFHLQYIASACYVSFHQSLALISFGLAFGVQYTQYILHVGSIYPYYYLKCCNVTNTV